MSCICTPLRVGNRPVDPDGPKSIRDDCPEHGLGTKFYKERADYWNERMKKVRS